METITEVKKMMFFRDEEAEHKKLNAAQAAAKALNEVYEHYKFKNISEIPVNVNQWMITRTLESDEKLAALAKVHKLESLQYQIPAWIQKAGTVFYSWHSRKSTFTQDLQFVKQAEDGFTVDLEKLEEHFNSSETYRRYYKNDEQLKRLDTCKRFIAILEETGISFPGNFTTYFGIKSNPFVRVCNGKFVPCVDYVLNGTMHTNIPVLVSGSYLILE